MTLYYWIYSETNNVSITTDNTPSKKWFDGTDLYTLKNFEEDDYTKQKQALTIITSKLNDKISDADLAQYFIDLYIGMVVSKKLSQVECNIEMAHYMYVIDRVLPHTVKDYTKYIDYIINMKRKLSDKVYLKLSMGNAYRLLDKKYIIDRVHTYRQCIGNDGFSFEALYYYYSRKDRLEEQKSNQMFSCCPQQMESMTPNYPDGGKREVFNKVVADEIVNLIIKYSKGEKHLIHLENKEGNVLPFLFKINDDECRFPYTVFYNSAMGECEYTLEDKEALHKFITRTLTLEVDSE